MAHSTTSEFRKAHLLGRRDFLALAAAAGAGLTSPNSICAAEPPRKPNVVVIVSDDQGYADVGYQGCKDIPTPNIDALANGGVHFTNGYVSCPVCSPTRAGLITGRYQQRFGHEFNPGPEQPNSDWGLRLDQTTLADQARAAGYHTGLVGKWHLGGDADHHPMSRGFEEFFGFIGGSHPYLDPSTKMKENPVLRGRDVTNETEYLTDAFTREACDYIRRSKYHPYFLLLTYNAVHMPAEAPQEYLARFKSIGDQGRRTYAAKLAAMDDGIGKVMAAVRASGAEQDTLTFFLSDNGGPTQRNGSRNTPLRGDKATVWEGGIRVPFAANWPRQIKPGSRYERSVISLDIFPTVLNAINGKVPGDRPIDGVDLMPFITGKNSGEPHQLLAWRFGEQYACRIANLKLARPEPGAPEKLFDLEKDISEAHDLSAELPRELKHLRYQYTKWVEQMALPAWLPERGNRARPASTKT